MEFAISVLRAVAHVQALLLVVLVIQDLFLEVLLYTATLMFHMELIVLMVQVETPALMQSIKVPLHCVIALMAHFLL